MRKSCPVSYLDHIVEDEKNARRFIKSLVPRKSQPNLHFEIINKFTNPSEIPEMLNPCLEGVDIGVISDAGCPGIADPGAAVVAEAHAIGIKVVPLVGPSSILLAMMASGFNGQNFAFNGYLPKDQIKRQKKLKELERQIYSNEQTQIFIETPFRNNQLFEVLLKSCNPETKLCVAKDVNGKNEFIKTFPIHKWKSIG